LVNSLVKQISNPNLNKKEIPFSKDLLIGKKLLGSPNYRQIKDWFK
jgi:hypothetical protein